MVQTNKKQSQSVKSTITKLLTKYPSEKSLKQKVAGYSLIELTVVVLIVGILAAIAVPGWLAFVNYHRLRTSTDRIYQAMLKARSNAKRDKVTWQASFQQQGEIAQWAVHQKTVEPHKANWQNLDSSVKIDSSETTLYQYPSSKYPSTDIWRMQFNYKGNANGQLGRITLSSRSGGKAKRCVFVSTLLGAMRTSKDQAKPKDGKYCY